MSRLIDVDVLIKRFESLRDEHETHSISYNALYEILVQQPTAYDVEKVVAELEEGGQKMSEAKGNPWDSSDHKYYKAISVKKATAIVKAGGVE